MRLQIPAGKATPLRRWARARPTRREHHGFLQELQWQDFGKDQEGLIIPVVITVYHDRTLRL